MESGEGIQRAEHATVLRFDRDGAGSGAEALCRMENGRARLEWRFYLAAYSGEQARRLLLPRDAAEFAPGTEMAEQFIRLWIRDREGNPVLECIHLLREEEPLESILPQPRIWNGMDSPYLYETEAALEDRNGNCLDRIRGFLPLRQVECRNREGRTQVFLNGENFERRMVRYALPETGNPAQRQRQILEDLRRLQKLGANCLLLEEPAGTQGKADCPSVFLCEVRRGEGKEGVSNLMSIYSSFTGKSDDEITREFEGCGYGKFKEAVGEVCADALSPVQAEFKRLAADKKYLEDVMARGAWEAKQNARRTMSKVRRKIGFIEPKRFEEKPL